MTDKDKTNILKENGPRKKMALDNEEVYSGILNLAEKAMQEETACEDTFPHFKVDFDLPFINEKDVPNMEKWNKTPNVLYIRATKGENSGTSVLEAKSLFDEPYEASIFPGFGDEQGTAVWQNADVGLGRSEIVAPEIHFKSPIYDLKNQTQRNSIKNSLLKLESIVFDYLKKGNQDLQKCKEHMALNYWMSLEIPQEKEDGMTYQKTFLQRGLKKESQERTFEKFFNRMDNYLNNPNKEKYNKDRVVFKPVHPKFK